MSVPHLRVVALALASSIALSACAYDEGYGYGGIGYASDGYYGDYYDGYYAGYGYPGYYGWYDDFYYPGVGVYIYDRSGHRHRWNDHYRQYWEGRRGSGGNHGANWDGFRNRDGQGSWQGSRLGNWNRNDGSWSRRQGSANTTTQAVPQSANTPPPPVARGEPNRSSWRAGPDGSQQQSYRGYYGGRRDRH